MSEDSEGEPETKPGDPSPSHTGARTILTVEERICHIVGMMERLEWVRGKSGPILAKEWGLSLSTVEGNAAEAHRRVVGDPDEVRRHITQGARKLLQETIDQGDKAGFRQIADVWMTISGTKAPEEHRIVTATATPAEAARLVRENFGEKAMPKPNGSNGHAKPNGAPPVPEEPPAS